MRQCENLSKEILCEQLKIDEITVEQIIQLLHDEHVLQYKYTFACPYCGELNTVKEGISEIYCCHNCDEQINIHEAIKGATSRYVIDRSDFYEFMDEKYKSELRELRDESESKSKVVSFQVINKKKEDSMMAEKKESKLFISHCSKDAEYVKAFVEFLEALGIPEGTIFCSSVEGYKIPWGKDIYDYLCNEFIDNKNLMVVFMLSANYYSSTACLNEMGATWVLKRDYRTILLPKFEFKKIEGAIDPGKIAIKLDSPQLNTDLNDVKKQFEEMFNFKAPVDAKWDRIRKNFIDAIQMANVKSNDCQDSCE